MILGLTGGLATGKSSAADELLRLGARVLDADVIAHFISNYDPTTLYALRSRFGEAVFSRYGALNRQVLADLAFTSSFHRRELELIMHPQVTAVIAGNVKAARYAGEPLVLMVPLLFEGGLNQLCDKVWVISSSESTQLERLGKLRSIDEVQARLRIGAQMPLIQKESQADLVIRNDGTIEELHAQVRSAWEGWVKSYEAENE